MRRSIFNLLELLLGILATCVLGACSFFKTPQEPRIESRVPVKLLAFNDFHGALESSPLTVADASAAGASRRMNAGGVVNLAATISTLRAAEPNTIVISAGDLVGASPLSSALTLDEGAIEAMNLMGVDFNAVGNHEFDRGIAELLRLQTGGCQQHTPLQPCAVNRSFGGAEFRFLSANIRTQDGATLFPASALKKVGQGARSVQVGVIGVTLRETPSLVTPSAVAGLTFEDEVQSINRAVPQLRAAGAHLIAVAIHQGGETTGDMNDPGCPGLRGPIVQMLDRIDSRVDVVITGHTHRAYACDYGLRNPLKPFLVTSAGQYGTLLTEIDIEYDISDRRIVRKAARNRIVSAASAANDSTSNVVKQMSALVERYVQQAEPRGRRVVGRLSADLDRSLSPSGESHLGNVVADAQWHATRDSTAGGSELALMNPGGLRADLVRDLATGEITFAQLFAAQPFGNTLVVMTLTGAQLHRLLEQQFPVDANESPRILFPSSSLAYSYDLRRPIGQRVSALRVSGKPVQDLQGYRVTVNSFLAAGGDRFSVLLEGDNRLGGPSDIEAMENYFAVHSEVALPALTRLNGDRRLARTTQ